MFDNNVGFSLKNLANNRFIACSDNGNVSTDAFNYGQGRHEWIIHTIEQAKYFCFQNCFSKKILISKNNKVYCDLNDNYEDDIHRHWILHPINEAKYFYLINGFSGEYLACSDKYDLLTEPTRSQQENQLWIIDPSIHSSDGIIQKN